MRRFLIFILTALFIFAGQPPLATASDSVEVPGQVSVDQCPVGYQYSTGISVNVTTHEFTTICNAAPNAEDILRNQQDQDFRERQDAAIASATAESQAWNAANPGQQKCVQWGPIVHANGVSTASGGVCANPVEIPNGGSTPTQSTAPVSGDVTLRAPSVIPPTDQPFSVQVSGQVSTEGCPSGYQAANGLEVNATTGQVSTVCWSEKAWQAWQLGGELWVQFVATKGAVDVALEIDRRKAVEALKAQALAVAQSAADETPGVKRCTKWSGYGDSGEECAYTFVAPADAPAEVQIISAGEQVLTTLASMPAAIKSSSLADSTKKLVAAYVSKLNLSVWPKGKKTAILPKPSAGKIIYKSTNTKVCSIVGNVVTKKSAGTCSILTVVAVNPWTKFSTTKQFVFKN